MRLAELVGSVSAIILAAVVFYSFAGSPPAYEYWGEAAERLVPSGFVEAGRAISLYIWENLFPALIAFAIALLTLILAVVALLRRD